MKRKIKKKLRHFKYWLTRKMYPDNELNFLVVPEQIDVQITEITARKTLNEVNYPWFGTEKIKEILLTEMIDSLKKYIEVSVEQDEEKIVQHIF